MKIQPLYAAPQHAEQVIDWLWQAFGDGLSRDFFASVVTYSQTPGALPPRASSYLARWGYGAAI